MTRLSEVIEIAQGNFERAHADLDADLAQTRTPAEARAVRENRDRALAAYMDLLTESLASSDSNFEDLALRATHTAKAVDDALERTVSHVDRLKLMAEVTTSLADIARALKG